MFKYSQFFNDIVRDKSIRPQNRFFEHELQVLYKIRESFFSGSVVVTFQSMLPYNNVRRLKVTFVDVEFKCRVICEEVHRSVNIQ